MTTIINSSNSTGLTLTSDLSGALALQTNGVSAVSVDTNQNSTFANSTTATAFIPSGSTVPTNGIYLPSANAVAISTGSTARLQVNSAGIMTNPYQPAFIATGNQGSVTITSSSNIPYNTLVSAMVGATRSSGYNTGTYTYTAPVTGLYAFYAQVYVSSSGFSLAWLKNGSQLTYTDIALWSYASGATGITQITGGNMIVELAAGDSISTRVRSGEPNVSVYMGHSCFLGYLIG